ncbi:MAG: integration host factor [Actinobacteria bacterium]|nr:integration host factor [Actinomycetota bacterium]
MPIGTDERAAAMEWASRVRGRRNDLRHALSSGVVSLAEVLDGAVDGDDALVRLLFVLESLPAAGKVATRRHLAALGLAGDMPIGELTAAQRDLVLAQFPRSAQVAPEAAP